MSELENLRIVVAEEFPLLCEALALLCHSETGGQVVAHCCDGAAALEQIEHHRPDIALLDFGLPTLFTLEIIRRLQLSDSRTRVVVLSTRRDRKTVMEALRCGAAGYVLKSGSPDQLRDAFGLVARGGVYVAPELEIGKMFAQNPRNPHGDPMENLSAREYQVFTMLVDGNRAKEIAARLELSPKTVDTYRASLMRKLDIHDVAGLVKFAMRREVAAGL